MKFGKYCLAFYLLAVFSLLLFINLYYLEGIPHAPDSQAYLFMAKIFATGHIIFPIAVSPPHFDFFPGILFVENGKWLFQYPFGHPLLLSLGVLLGFPNLIPPLVGTLFVFILFCITREVYDLKTAVFVSILPILSPFFLENASSFMSHNTATFYSVFSIYFLLISLKNSRFLPAFLSGVFLGLLFNTRPLTFIPFFLLVLILIFSRREVGYKLKMLLFFSSGLILLLLVWLAYNYVATGNPLIPQYYLSNQGLVGIGQGVSLTEVLSQRLKNFTTLFKNLGPMLFNWPVIITYLFLAIPFILRKNVFWDNLFFLSLFILPFVYFFYNGVFLFYGPRFWYEILPFVFLLTARSFALMSQYLPRATLAIFVFLIFISWGRFLGFLPVASPDIMSPLKLAELQGFNFVDTRIIKETKRNNIHNAVIFVKDCGINWWCYGSVFSQNSPTLNTDVVYVKDLGNERNKIIFEHFRERSFYTIDYYALEIEKVFPTE